MDPFWAVISVLLGLVLGSFFNVLIYRLPRHESIATPGSHCPHCGRPVRPWENIPVASYLVLRGRCAGCGWRIPLSYPIVELMTGVAALLLYGLVVAPAIPAMHSCGLVVQICLTVLVLLLVIPLAIIDLFNFIIPDAITLPLLVCAALLSFLPGGITPLQCGLGILAGGGSLFVVGIAGEYIFKKDEVMGGGDIKLMALAGAVFGWQTAFLTIVMAAVIGSVGGILMIAFKKFAREHRIPFGPFLTLSLWIAVLWGDRIICLYFSFVDKAIG
jgi:leader peptidase (prepilin peptidase)/N-methyltransferase